MCFEGFTGRGCQYDECPNNCNGHGTCEFIEDLSNVLPPTERRGIKLSDRSTSFHPQISRSWEYHKVRACKCDPQWLDHDCSRRMCPRSNDVMDHREDTTDQVKLQKQEIHLFSGGKFGSGLNSSRTDFLNGSFSLIFVSLLNETYHTRPLKLDRNSFFGIWSQNWDTLAYNLAADIEDALLELPNKVVDEIDVDVSFADVLDGNGFTWHSMIFNFTMTSENLVGRQNLFAVDADECLYPGCSPVLEGLNLITFEGEGGPWFLQNYTAGFIEETQVTDYNSYECGRRGQCDYRTGICHCFEGFTGPACATMTELA